MAQFTLHPACKRGVGLKGPDTAWQVMRTACDSQVSYVIGAFDGELDGDALHLGRGETLYPEV